jgi:isoquinoline 1-oxidoreductase beta subunit
MPGVQRVVVVDPSEPRKPLDLQPIIKIADSAPCSAVAVVADHYWQARNALEALPIEWDDGPGARWKTTQQIYDTAIAETQHAGEKVVVKQGDVTATLARNSRKVEAVYVTPLCDHMVMEPLNGTAMVTAGRVDLWHPTQQSQQAFRIAAEETGVALENVHFHQTFVGGAFGRRAFGDDVRMVVAVAKRFPGRPVQVVWSREETTRQGRYRPMQAVRLIAGLGDSGMPDALLARVCGHGIFNVGINDCAYISGIPHFQLETQELPLHIYPGPYRGPGYNSNAFVLESFIDECAHEAGIDPLEYRQRLLAKWPDTGWQQCLREVADKSSWGKSVPHGQGRGIAIANWAGWGKPQAGTTVAAAAHVEVTQSGELRILRVDVAFDCGKILNRDAALAQIEGATIYGLNMTLNEELTVQDGRIVEGNFDQYPMLRLADVPRQLHVHLGGLSQHERFGMLGEPGVGPVGPAIANAIFQATGRRLRSTPFRKLDLRWA